jgi:hypothetical protein
MTSTGVLYASKLLGAKVNSRTGEGLGELSEIILDGAGRGRYGVVKAGGGLLSSGKFYPMPFDAFDLQSDEETLVIGFGNEVFDSAPHFESDKWPDMSRKEWQDSIQSFYDVHVS